MSSLPSSVGLALGSGGARGLAHIGVLDALRDKGVEITHVTGTSMGSLVGGLYAANCLPDFKEAVLDLDWKELAKYFIEVNYRRSGLLTGNKILEFIEQFSGDPSIDELSVPYAAVAADIASGEEVILQEGKLLDAIRASVSIPGMFTPVTRNGVQLVDGGIVNPVPIAPCRDLGAEYVLAVDLNLGRVRPPSGRTTIRHKKEKRVKEKAREALEWLESQIARWDMSMPDHLSAWIDATDEPSLFDVLGNSLRILESQVTELKLQTDAPDTLLRPHVGHISFMQFDRADELIEEGYKAVENWAGGRE